MVCSSSDLLFEILSSILRSLWFQFQSCSLIRGCRLSWILGRNWKAKAIFLHGCVCMSCLGCYDLEISIHRVSYKSQFAHHLVYDIKVLRRNKKGMAGNNKKGMICNHVSATTFFTWQEMDYVN